MDIWTKKKRSHVMSNIRSRNTKPEILLRSYLHKHGFRFRVHEKKLPGKPDIVLPKYKTIIFVHGCFWHQHKNCIDGRIPKSRTKYWKEKLDGNVRRDRKYVKDLKKLGWRVLAAWECEIEKEEIQLSLVRLLKANLLLNETK